MHWFLAKVKKRVLDFVRVIGMSLVTVALVMVVAALFMLFMKAVAAITAPFF